MNEDQRLQRWLDDHTMLVRFAGVIGYWNERDTWGYIKYWCPETNQERSIKVKKQDFKHDFLSGIREGLWVEFNLHRETNHLPFVTGVCTRPEIGTIERLKDFNMVQWRTRRQLKTTNPVTPPPNHGFPQYPGYNEGWGGWEDEDWDDYCVLRRGPRKKPDFTPELLDRKEVEALFDGEEK